MIIDLILDRQDGVKYNSNEFFHDVASYGAIGADITTALAGGKEKEVKKQLCLYVIGNDYSHKICDYIHNVNWLRVSK